MLGLSQIVRLDSKNNLTSVIDNFKCNKQPMMMVYHVYFVYPSRYYDYLTLDNTFKLVTYLSIGYNFLNHQGNQ